jgi:hypothetical protein
LVGSASPAGSPIGSMRSCSASSRAPTIIAFGCWNPTAIRRKRCGRSRARVRI